VTKLFNTRTNLTTLPRSHKLTLAQLAIGCRTAFPILDQQFFSKKFSFRHD